MEYTARIIQEQKAENGFWKYDFLDSQTRKEDYFYSHGRIDYIPNVLGRLELLFDNQNQAKLFQSFEQGLEEEEILAQFEEGAEQSNEKLEINFATKRVKLTVEFLNKLHYVDKYKWKTIAKIYGTSVWTLQRLRKGRKTPKQKVGRKQKIDGVFSALLLAHVKKNNTATQQERADYFEKKGIRLHRSTISRTLQRIGRSQKIATKQYSELNIKKAKQFLVDNYWLFSSPNCLALDEFGVNLGETSRYAYSRKGCRAIISRKGQRGFNHTFILCVRNVNNQTVVSYKTIKNEKKKIKNEKTGKVRIKKGTDAVDFYNFLKDIELPTNEKYYLLLDNTKIHYTTKELRKLGLSIKELAIQKNITLVYLPAYAPMMNPTELCINFIKGYVRKKRFWNEEELIKTVEEAIVLLNQKDLTKWFLSCRDYFYFVKNEQ